MTDNEIIMALECCIKDQHEGCCKLGSWSEQWNCMTDLMKDAIDLINRQKAEIERLQKYNTEVAFKHHNDGAKEFAEKTNQMITQIYNKHIFGNNDLEAEEKDAIINFSDDVTNGLETILEGFVTFMESLGVKDAG